MKGGAFMAQHPDAAKQQRWLALVRKWLDSGLSVRDFCHRHRLSEPSFYAWRRALRDRRLLEPPPPVAASPSANASTAALGQLTASLPGPSPTPSTTADRP